MKNVTAYAFDVYGTLIDTNGVLEKLRQHVGDKAGAVSATWRAKQLEYSFRRGLMQQYVPFPVVTEQALEFALMQNGFNLPTNQRADIQSIYASLPAFRDAGAALKLLQHTEIALYAFSNGPRQVVSELLEQAGLLPYFQDVVSVELTKTFKPNPIVYQHFSATTGHSIGQCALVSGNTFDVIGAIGAGMQGVWVNRGSNATFDPWDIHPNQMISDLSQLTGQPTP